NKFTGPLRAHSRAEGTLSTTAQKFAKPHEEFLIFRLRNVYRQPRREESYGGNGGRYAPDTGMTTEILCADGAESLVRLGSCGSLQDQVKVGDLVIVTGAIRGEGTTSYYVPKNFSTVAHPDIVGALQKAAESLQVSHHLGRIFTTDALF